MASELVEGKRTLIERNGDEFELPYQHRMRLLESVGEEAAETWISLSTPGDGSLFRVRDIEERDNEVVVHLGSELARHSIGTGPVIRETRGYPFPRRS
jgi:hypothetical protein